MADVYMYDHMIALYIAKWLMGVTPFVLDMSPIEVKFAYKKYQFTNDVHITYTVCCNR